MNSKLIALLILALALAGCRDSESNATPTDAAEASGRAAEVGHEETESAIALTPEQLEAAGIETAAVGPASIRETLPLYGVISPNAERVREVAARFPGAIRDVNVKIGDTVKQGQALATVESNESLQAYSVTAPLAGVITARNANPGEQAGDKALFTIADLSTVWVELSLFPRDVAKVHVGQIVRVQSPDTGLDAEGTLVYVAPFGQSANQTLTARVLLENSERDWAPGLYVTAEVTLAETPVPLAVRNEAVQNFEGGDVVFVQGEKGFAPHAIQLGRGDGEYTELISGPEAGERYVTTNSFILKAELGKGETEHGH